MYLVAPPADRGGDIPSGWVPFYVRGHEMLTRVQQRHITSIVKLQDTIITEREKRQSSRVTQI